jgi:hypothetical protein
MRPTLALAAALPLALAVAGPARAQTTWEDAPIGRTAVLHLRTAPFPHASRPQYHDDRVLVFVPRGYAPGEAVDIVVHYHGHRAEAVSSAKQRRLREQLVEANKAAILLCPQGPLRAADSGGGKHEEPGGLRRFLEEALARLADEGVVPRGARPGRVILSGHSGAYRVIARDLAVGEVDVSEVWLHDSVYGFIDVFAAWAGGEGRRLVSTHTPGGGTRANNGVLRQRLLAAGVPVSTREAGLSDGSRVVILAVPEAHDLTTNRLVTFARTSCLDDLPAVAPPTSAPVPGLTGALPGH